VGCGSHGSRLRVLGFSGLTGCGFKPLGSAEAPPPLDFSLDRRSWRIESSWVQRVTHTSLVVTRVSESLRVAGSSEKTVLLAHRRRSMEDRAPSPSTLLISSLSQHLSVSPSKTLSSISQSHSLVSLSVGCSGIRRRRTKKDEEKGINVQQELCG
jgi:hypothetical protein